jgi:large conductance mechanosensitive channel
MLKEFRSFVLRGNVVDLAIGVVIGAAFTGIVNALVKGFINPLIALVTPAGSLEGKSFCIGTVVRHGKPVCAHTFVYGDVLSAMLQFLIVAAVIFFFVVKPVNALMERFKGDTPTDDSVRECPMCLSKIPKKARRCAFCAADVGAVA